MLHRKIEQNIVDWIKNDKKALLIAIDLADICHRRHFS